MSDILTRLLLDSKDFESKLGKAKKSTGDFSSAITNLATGAVGKFVAAIGLAVGGAEGFERVMKSSQTTGDAFANTLSACKSTVDVFFQSLATGNWDAFNGGLSETLENLRDVAALKDALGDAKLSLAFDTRQFEREYVRLEGIIDDETKTKAEREKAFASMQALISDFRAKVEATGQGAANTLVKELNSRFGKDFSLADVNKYISSYNNEFLNNEDVANLKAYKKELADLQAKQYSYVTQSGSFGTTDVKIENTEITKQIEALKARNVELERMRLLSEDTDANRRSMVSEYEYVLEMQQKGDEFLKRSLEKQNKIINLNKNAAKGVATGGKAEFPIVVPQVHYDTPIGRKMLEAMAGKEFDPIVVPIQIEESGLDGDVIPQQIQNNVEYKDSILDVVGAVGSLTGSFSAGASTAVSYFSSIVSGVLQASAAIAALIPLKKMEANANAEVAVSGAAASAASTPIVGWLMAGAAVAAVIAAMTNIPKFAQGGIVGGSSFVGDKLLARVNSGEMILNQNQQSRLLGLTNGGNVRVSGDVRLNGKDIYISLRNYMASSGNKL